MTKGHSLEVPQQIVYEATLGIGQKESTDHIKKGMTTIMVEIKKAIGTGRKLEGKSTG